VDREEFITIRSQLGKTQRQMSALLGTSLKAVQSFEQGWRNIPANIERHMLFLLARKNVQNTEHVPCWDMENCTIETRQNCPAWEFQSGNLCWFINGTICRGEPQGSWGKKMEKCRKCTVFRSIFSSP
jgi:hypothetical protein